MIKTGILTQLVTLILTTLCSFKWNNAEQDILREKCWHSCQKLKKWLCEWEQSFDQNINKRLKLINGNNYMTNDSAVCFNSVITEVINIRKILSSKDCRKHSFRESLIL